MSSLVMYSGGGWAAMASGKPAVELAVGIRLVPAFPWVFHNRAGQIANAHTGFAGD
ncbi:MAG: hypothetical protein H6882_11955 [Rhodobiaceae bacterium]|nr:hypothetical protein [Rhodobiaceae bacterium]